MSKMDGDLPIHGFRIRADRSGAEDCVLIPLIPENILASML